jgi:HK97 family phage major capsid protein
VENLNERLEALEKAYTEAGVITAGTNWAGAAPADSFRGQLGSPSAEVLLTDAERQFLVDRVVDESSLLKVCRKLTMNRSRVEIPRMSLGTRVMRSAQPGGHVETYPYYAPGVPAHVPVLPAGPAGQQLESGAAEHLVSPTYSTVVLESSKLVLPWAITEEFLEDNPEQGAAEQRIATIMGIQAANDLEDLALNGDETSLDALLRANDGYLKQAAGAGGNISAGLGAFTTNTFETIVRSLPTKYRRNFRQLRFIVHPDTWMDYVQSIASRQGNMADQYLSGLVGDPTYGGIPIMASPFMPAVSGGTGQILLTHPDNLIFGVEREMKMRKTMDGQNAIYNDERYYALHIRSDFVIQNVEATALGTDLDIRVP